MRVFLTGGHGFVGRHLQRELEFAGHTVVAPPSSELDVRDADAVASAIIEAAPDAVAHLAGIAFAPDARADPALAMAVNVGGTINVLEAVRACARRPAVLVTGSADVYGDPDPADLPLTEDAPLRPTGPYGLSKAAQESVALAYAQRYGLPVVVTRAFNHSGPGQRQVFVIPALAERVLAVKQGRATTVRVGNLDVRRDFSHVLDVVVAYCLLLEAAAAGKADVLGNIFNVASGTACTVREILTVLYELAAVRAAVEVDPALIRSNEAGEVRGDPSRLRASVGLEPARTLGEVLADVWRHTSATGGPRSGSSG